MSKQDYLQDPKTGKLAGSRAGARQTPQQRKMAPVEFSSDAGSPPPVVARQSVWVKLGPRLLGGPTFSRRAQSELEKFSNTFVQYAETMASTRVIALGPFLLVRVSKRLPRPGSGDLDRRQAAALFTNGFPYGASVFTLGKSMVMRRARSEARVEPAQKFAPNPYETDEERAAKVLVREVRLAAMPGTVRDAVQEARAIRG